MILFPKSLNLISTFLTPSDSPEKFTEVYWEYGIHSDHSPYPESNNLLIENYVVPLKASIKLTNGREKKTDLDFAIERYKNHQKLSKYDETEFNYIHIDTILENKEALIDPEWMVEYVVTKFQTI